MDANVVLENPRDDLGCVLPFLRRKLLWLCGRTNNDYFSAQTLQRLLVYGGFFTHIPAAQPEHSLKALYSSHNAHTHTTHTYYKARRCVVDRGHLVAKARETSRLSIWDAFCLLSPRSPPRTPLFPYCVYYALHKQWNATAKPGIHPRHEITTTCEVFDYDDGVEQSNCILYLGLC